MAVIEGAAAHHYIRSRPASEPLLPVELKTQTASDALDHLPAEAKPDAESKKPAGQQPAPKAPAALEGVSWDFEGQVYDMLTLKPVPGVEMTFYSDEGNHQTKSGKDGRYRISLPGLRSGGYRLQADHPDYADEYFDDPGSALRKAPLKQRAGLRNSNPTNLPWSADRKAPLRRDVVLFPFVPDR